MTYTPNMKLVAQYNKLKHLQRPAIYNGQKVTLYKPEKSTRKDKKLRVFVEGGSGGGRIVKVEFGHPNYEDYTIHRDEARRANYCARSGGINCGAGLCDVTSANYWARMVLWNC